MDGASKYFSLSQLWLSLAIVAAVGAGAWASLAIATQRPPAAVETLESATTTAAAAIEARNPYEGIRLSAQAAIVLDLATGQTLYSQNADAKLPLASLTKILSVYAADRALAPGQQIAVSSSSVAQEGDSGIEPGESFAVEDLARMALVASSNDAADALTAAAAATQGGERALLASAASAAGLARTEAFNGTGLDLDPTRSGGYGTARDVATLAGRFVEAAPELARASTRPALRAYSAAGEPHDFSNTNPFVSRMPGLKLSKTGFTDLAGGNLAVVYDAGIAHPVAIVVLGSTRDARFTDVLRLMDATQERLGLAAPVTP